MFHNKAVYFIFLTLCFVSSIALAKSENQVTVRGHVLYENRMPLICNELPCDSSDRTLPIHGALVVAKKINSASPAKTVYTDNQGQYRLKLSPGSYKISTNFQEKTVKVKNGRSSLVDFRSIVY